MLRPHYTEAELQLAHHYDEIRRRLMGPMVPAPRPPVALRDHAFIERPKVKIDEPKVPPPDDTDHWAAKPPKPLQTYKAVHLIQRRVAHEFPNMSVERLTGLYRDVQTVWPRHIAEYLIRTLIKPTLSYPQIGRFFGKRDHSTILHGVRKCEWYMAQGDNVVSECIKRLRGELEAKINLWTTCEENHVEDEGLAVRGPADELRRSAPATGTQGRL